MLRFGPVQIDNSIPELLQLNGQLIANQIDNVGIAFQNVFRSHSLLRALGNRLGGRFDVALHYPARLDFLANSGTLRGPSPPGRCAILTVRSLKRIPPPVRCTSSLGCAHLYATHLFFSCSDIDRTNLRAIVTEKFAGLALIAFL